MPEKYQMDNRVTQEEMTKEALLQALSWQVESGCDAALIDTPAEADEWRVSLADIMAAQPISLPGSSSGQSSGSAPVSSSVVSSGSAPEKQASPTIAGVTEDLTAIKTLDGLKETLASFEGCELKRTATNMVFADGNPAAKILVLGEAPGKDEDRMGLPFVGSAGQLLDQMLGAVGLDRHAVYIANIMPWRPPGNRALTEEEIEMMRPFVEAHIRLIAPDVILSLGGTASKMMLQTQDGIMKLRGKFFDYQPQSAPDTTIPLLPCLHPGYLLRAPHHKSFVFKDLVRLRRKSLELAT